MGIRTPALQYPSIHCRHGSSHRTNRKGRLRDGQIWLFVRSWLHHKTVQSDNVWLNLGRRKRQMEAHSVPGRYQEMVRVCRGEAYLGYAVERR